MMITDNLGFDDHITETKMIISMILEAMQAASNDRKQMVLEFKELCFYEKKLRELEDVKNDRNN